MRFFYIILWLWFPSIIFSQTNDFSSKAKAISSSKNLASAKVKDEQLLKIYESQDTSQIENKITYTYERAKIFYFDKQYHQADSIIINSLKLYNSPQFSERKKNALNLAALASKKANDTDKRILYLSELVKTYPISYRNAKGIKELADYYIEKGQFLEAEQCVNVSNFIYDSIDMHESNKATLLITASELSAEVKDTASIPRIENWINDLKSQNRDDDIFYLQFNLINLYDEAKNYKAAINASNKLLESESDLELKILNNKAHSLVQLNKLEEAKRLISNTLNKNDVPVEISWALYNNWAEVLIREKNYQEGIEKSRMAVAQLILDFPENTKTNHEPRNVIQVLSDHLSFLSRMPDIKKHEAELILTTEVLQNQFNALLKEVKYLQTAYWWREDLDEAYLKAIEAAYTIENFSLVNTLSEQRQASVLLFEKIKNLNEVNQAKWFGDEAKILSRKTIEKDITNLIDQIQVEHTPLAFDNKILSIEQIQNRLQADETILKFIQLSDRTFLRMLISNEYFQVDEILISKDFLPISSLIESKAGIEELSNNVLSNLTTKELKKKVIIIPDGDLNTIPFEILKHNDIDLINYITQYGFSVSSFYTSSNSDKLEKLLFFAPITYSPDLNLSALNMSRDEIKTMSKYQKYSLIEDQASATNLFEHWNNSKILHLSTHGLANVGSLGEAWFATNDRKIYLSELFEHNTDANLVVLSACETNLGTEIKGEGVISLARGFIQSGANSVIASQWKVNEKSTAEILSNFYKNLTAGHTKAQSLQLAKQQYISDHPDIAQSPYYWAGLVYYGQDGNISIKKKTPWTTGLQILSIIVLSIFILIKIKSEV